MTRRRACLEYLRISGRNPDIIHAHEWQLSAVPMLYWCAPHPRGCNEPSGLCLLFLVRIRMGIASLANMQLCCNRSGDTSLFRASVLR